MTELEGESHITLICSLYNEYRVRYVPEYFHKKHRVQMFIELMRNSDNNILLRLPIFL